MSALLVTRLIAATLVFTVLVCLLICPRGGACAHGSALLKTETGASLPLACTMQAGSALKERILNLQQGTAPRRMRFLALLVLASLGVAGGRIAWAASLEVVKVAVVDGLRDADGRACEAELTPQLRRGDTVDLRMLMRCGGQIAGNPRLITRLGEPATIAIGRNERQPDGSFAMTHGFKLTIRFDKP